MHEVGAFEAKTHLAQLLTLVEKGEAVTITKRGKPVAMLVPVSEHPERNPRKAAEDLLRLRKALPSQGGSMRDLIEEGRRF